MYSIDWMSKEKSNLGFRQKSPNNKIPIKRFY